MKSRLLQKGSIVLLSHFIPSCSEHLPALSMMPSGASGGRENSGAVPKRSTQTTQIIKDLKQKKEAKQKERVELTRQMMQLQSKREIADQKQKKAAIYGLFLNVSLCDRTTGDTMSLHHLTGEAKERKNQEFKEESQYALKEVKKLDDEIKKLDKAIQECDQAIQDYGCQIDRLT